MEKKETIIDDALREASSRLWLLRRGYERLGDSCFMMEGHGEGCRAVLRATVRPDGLIEPSLQILGEGAFGDLPSREEPAERADVLADAIASLVEGCAAAMDEVRAIAERDGSLEGLFPGEGAENA